MTSKGLNIELALSPRVVKLLRSCSPVPTSSIRVLPWYLPEENRGSKNHFARVNYEILFQVYERAALQQIVVPQSFHSKSELDKPLDRVMQVRKITCSVKGPGTHISGASGLLSYVARQAIVKLDFYDNFRAYPLAHESSVEYIPDDLATAYKVVSGSEALSGAILFRRESDGSQFFLLLGTHCDGDLGFDIIEYIDGWKLCSLETYGTMFRARSSGERMSLPFLDARVDVKYQRLPGATYFMLDIGVKGQFLVEKRGSALEKTWSL